MFRLHRRRRLFPRRCEKAGCGVRGVEREDGYWLCARHAREYRQLVPPILRRDST